MAEACISLLQPPKTHCPWVLLSGKPSKARGSETASDMARRQERTLPGLLAAPLQGSYQQSPSRTFLGLQETTDWVQYTAQYGCSKHELPSVAP